VDLGAIIRNIANKILNIMVFSAIFYIFFKIYKVIANNQDIDPMTSFIQLIVLFFLAVISLILTTIINKYCRRN
jgi:hypothetical protein